jgi:SAM-dependent methyltransferase
MIWDPIWEWVFRSRDWGKYPPEELIRFVARNYYAAPDRAQVEILEVGCGTGANIWYLSREGFSAYGIDGSSMAIEKARQRLKEESLAASLKVGDATALKKYFPLEFDAVIDIACLQHNGSKDVEAILSQIYQVLKPGGRFFGMMAVKGSWGDGTGREIEPNTFIDITEGPYAGKGETHFFSEEEIRRILSQFSNVQIETAERSMENRKHKIAHWVVEGTRPS